MSSRTRRSRNAFGATAPPFIDYLKDILRRYPDGGQILKELIQNADDAGASEVKFIHDERTYGCQSLCSDALGKYQGPALYVFNNAVFTEEDWQGIQETGRSVKRNDPNKVGRFGIGFNSVYHITDVPCIFSSKYLGILDPQEKLFGEQRGGIRWSLVDKEDQDKLMNVHDQFQPFQEIVTLLTGQSWQNVVMEDQHFNGTLFRFPLRCEASEISDNLYNSDKVVELFDSFITDADICPLFLRNVSSVSLMHISTNGSVNVRLEVASSSLAADLILGSGEESSIKTSTCFKVITSISKDQEEPKKTKWLVTTCCMREGHVPELDALAKKLCFRPQVDLAFQCGQERVPADGRLSCFLPLPNNEANKTGLPVHVNACFGLTDNRRHIKWQEEDQKYDEAALWNELLIKDVLPLAYISIVQDGINLSKGSEFELPASSVYDLWPDISQTEHKDKWDRVAKDALNHLFGENIPVFSLAGNERQFVSLSEAVCPSNNSMASEIMAAVTRTLIVFGEKLVTFPDHVSRAVKWAFPEADALKWVTPAFVRGVLHRDVELNIPKEDKLSVLEYILSDGDYHDLRGLQLLPLSDGTFTSFTENGEEFILIDNDTFPRVLLPGCQTLFLPQDLSTTSVDHLRKLAATNSFNVLNLDAEIVASSAMEYVPKDWNETEGHVTWNTGNVQHPPLRWLREFWKFLNTHMEELSRFTGMPLIPIEVLRDDSHPKILARLQQKPTLLFKKSKQTTLSDRVAEVISKVGGTVVNRDECLYHQDLDSYVLPPCRKSILQVFMNLDAQQAINGVRSASHREKEELKDYLSSLDCLSIPERDLLSRLPLFRLMTGDYVAAQSKQAVVLSSVPTIPTDLPVPDSIVQCATEADRRLLLLLNVDLLNSAQVAINLVDAIERRSFRKEETEKIMTWILKHGSILCSQSKDLCRRCNDLHFIEMDGGELRKTSCFFDPRNQKFKVLFETDFFPPPVFTKTPQMIESLTCLGLLTKETDITPSNVLHAATQIEKLHVHSPKEADKRSETLLRILNDNDLLSKFSKQQLVNLSLLEWVSCVNPGVMKENSKESKQTRSFFKPDEMRHLKYEEIVGHVMPLTGKFNEGISSKLGLLRLPPAEKVLDNLSEVNTMAQAMIHPDGNVQFKKKLHSTYKFMQDHVSDFREVMKNCKPWLWIHNHFVSPREVVLAYPPDLDLSSYIGKVPEEFLPYKKLFTEFGVRPSLSEKEIGDILINIRQTIDERQPPIGNPSELKVSIAILNWMKREMKTVSEDTPVPIMARGQRFTLKPLSRTLFCDISRDCLEDLENDPEESYIIHEEIPRVTAEWLKIPLLSTRILNPEYIGIEQCGQSEPITLRIKNILKEYDEDNDIFKELIQNAEDSGAKTCKFMVDFRKHKDSPESLIDPGMSLCKGPCLWAFNDELFTEDDWGNIVRLGSASKENQIDKIGKFGLGFNTVYHLTDIPSILSGKGLLILDPNVTHLAKHIKSKANPGIKLDLSRQQLLHRFPGQFTPYEHIFECNLSRESTQTFYPGTLIKLPFRTQEEALKSEISRNVYDTDDIITLQQDFTKNSQTHLLFLRNVNTVSLQNLPDNASTPPKDDQIETLFTVSKEVETTFEIPDDIALAAMQSNALNMLIKTGAKCSQIIDFHNANIAKITQQRCDGADVQFWLLYNCFGTRESLQMVQRGNQQTTFSLPIGGIAVPLSCEKQTGKWVKSETKLVGQAFCFLPLSIVTGLPVNVNGSFAVTSNRKGLWETGVKYEWNRALLQDAITTAYVTILLVLKNMAQSGQLQSYHYFTFWPNEEKVSKAFRPLVDAFYSAIAQTFSGKTLELLSDGGKWCSMDKARFLHPHIEENTVVGKLAMEVCQSNSKASYHVVPLPRWVRNSFSQAGFDKILQDRTLNWEDFYREVVFNNLSTMDQKTRDALVLHAIDLNESAVDNLLRSYACIPTQTEEQLQFTKKLVNPSGKVACLFEPEEGRFLCGTRNDFCSPKRIQRLLELGMLSDHLPLNDITERAERMDRIWHKDKKKAFKHLECLLELMRGSLKDEDSPHWDTLRNTAFIPATLPVKSSKNNVTVTLKRPVEVYSYNCRNLVSLTQAVVDHSNLKIHSHDPVLHMLGICNSPPLETVLQQLKEASSLSQNYDKMVLFNIAHSCYWVLNALLDSDRGHTNRSLISQRAHSFPFILVEDKFVDVTSVAENGEFGAKPYLHVLPRPFDSFKELWKCVGISKQFTAQQFLDVLQKLYNFYGGTALSNSDLQICLTIIARGLYEAKDEKQTDCPIPDENRVLQPASKLYYNDSAWIPVSGLTLCHEKISRALALNFGVKTTRHHTLQDHLVENFSPFATEFGQQEKLTVRIKNIMSAYPSKKDILKELIQNADDAGATEIHFVWDKRQHSTQKTFGKGWNALQGPALCVYNNQVFSDADLTGIQQLGEGGKRNIPGKTGKYGLGFNSVYHLTDCPSILTGDKWLCISDPTRKYIEGRNLPGCKFELKEKFKDTFIDVYKTFLPEEFSLQDGTMFRLPLRMGAMANGSEISDQGVTERDMQELYSALSDDPEGLILFLRNICKIQFHEVNPDTNNLRTTCSIEKLLPEESREEKVMFQKCVEVEALLSYRPMTPHKAIYNVQISSSDKGQSDWIIAEQLGSFKNTGGGGDQSDKVPQAALAACLRSRPAGEEFVGRAFCSLPLPVQTGLPIHVNGNFEVDSSRRDLWKADGKSLKAEWNESLKLNIIAPLYADLLHHIRYQQKKFKLLSLHSGISALDNSYLCFFPHVSKYIGQQWHDMIHEVYRTVNERELRVIPVLQSTIRQVQHRLIKKLFIDWCTVSKKEPTEAPHLDATAGPSEILLDLGMKLVPFSTKMSKIWTSFKSAGVGVKTVSPATARDYLKIKPMNDSTETDFALPLPISQTLIRDKDRCSRLLKYCLEDITKEDTHFISGLPLLLTQDQILRVFNPHEPKLMTRFNRLFHGYEEEFADYTTNLDYIRVLQYFKFLRELTIPLAVPYLKPLVLHLLQDCDVDPHCELYVPDEKIKEWLKELWSFLSSEIRQKTSAYRGDSDVLNDIGELFSDFPILPVVCPRLDNKHLLQKIRNMSSVIQYSHQEIPSILLKLGLIKLDFSFFADVDKNLHQQLQPGLLDTSNGKAVLDQVFQLRHSEFQLLSKDELNKLQYFLQSGASRSKEKQDYLRKLKSLPLFETIQGQRQRIDGHRKVFILKTELVESFPDLYMEDIEDNIILKHTVENENLAHIVNIPILTDMEYYVHFILPATQRLSETQVINSVKLLLSLQYLPIYHQYHEKIISTMTNVKFIRSAHGNLERASYFFDESVLLFKTMLPQERFVPKRFWDIFHHQEMEAKHLLKKFGMKHKVTDDEIIEFAHQIESEAKHNLAFSELKLKSSTLFEYILKRDVKKNVPNFLKNIGGIKFVYPIQIQDGLCKYHQPFATERTTVAIRGSLIQTDPSHQYLIWTSMPILPNSSQMHIKTMRDAGAVEKPTPDHVTGNLRNVCESSCQSKAMIVTRADVFRRSYAYLQTMDFDARPLTNLPLVLVEADTNLVKAKQTALLVPHDLEFRPYLYRIPPEDVIYEKFFKRIGVNGLATAEQYCSVLEEIHVDSSNKQSLHSNQQRAVKRAVEQLFCLIRDMQGNQSTPNLPKVMYLPARDGRLYPSNTLYFNDTVFQVSRFEEALENKVQLLEELRKCHLKNDMYEHQKLLQLLPQELRPKMLSQISVEKLVEPSKLACEHGELCEFSGWFQKHLSSACFMHGLMCLIREQFKSTISEEDAASMCQKTFGSIQILCCKSLETMLWLGGKPLTETAADTQMYIKKGQQGCTIFLRHNDEMSPQVLNVVNMRLTKEINALLGNRLSSDSLLVLGQLLLCDDMQNVLKTLEENEIHNCAQIEDFLPPVPGSLIPTEWHDALDMNVLNNFEEGEYVGYRKQLEEEYCYAVIAEQLDVPFGKSGQYSCIYKIQIGHNEFIEVNALDIYQFKRGKKPFTSTGATCMVLQHLADSVPRMSRTSVSSGSPQSIEEIKKEIDRCLSEIWTLSEEERCKALRRLYLRWHPDKNLDCQQLATEAFKYLTSRIEEHENEKSGHSASARWNTNFSDLYQQWNREAHHHRRGREGFHRHRNSNRSHYNFWTYHGNVPQPNRAEAHRWSKQAHCDLAAARNDTGGGSTEWCLFKVHQAVEKALIAAEYKTHGQHPTNCSISSLVERISHYTPRLSTLVSIVNRLKVLGVDPKKTQYPNCHPSPRIPNEQFESGNEAEALTMASEVLSKVDAYIN